jgi:cyclohexadienyl dehydratase
MGRWMIASLMLLFAAAPVWAQNLRLDMLVTSGKLRVGIPGDYRPFALRDPASGKIDGFDIDMAEGLATSLGSKSSLCRQNGPIF